MLADRIDQSFNQVDKNNVPHYLSNLFESLIKEYSSFDFHNIKPNITKHSHDKQILIQEQTSLGLLVFEAMVFKNGIFTGPHTHAEYFIEKIIHGNLEEIQYKKIDDFFETKQTIIRTSKDSPRLINCPIFFPHNVRAVNGNAHSFCLSLGDTPIKTIDVR